MSTSELLTLITQTEKVNYNTKFKLRNYEKDIVYFGVYFLSLCM